MARNYFVHEIKGKDGVISNKGIVVSETVDAAKQAYHAYLGAYAYGHDPDSDFVQCMITDSAGELFLQENWNAPQPEPNA